ncbi:MAG TPA: hypothetical protein VG892_08890 [Terriglobales bacterium]|jgi:hypothetical protein|nr:hypothetical protein [Terriglobales bacterium]
MPTGSILEFFAQQRLILSSALIVALVLILIVGAPIVPIVVGCVAVVLISVFRTRSGKKPSTRG